MPAVGRKSIGSLLLLHLLLGRFMSWTDMRRRRLGRASKNIQEGQQALRVVQASKSEVEGVVGKVGGFEGVNVIKERKRLKKFWRWASLHVL
jgi:hypothetical protein